jgi:hypothetical protein
LTTYSDQVQRASGIIEEDLLLEDILIDNTYLYINDNIDSKDITDKYITNNEIDIIRSKGFKVSNSVLNSNLFIGKDNKDNTWYADLNQRVVSFIRLREPTEPGLFHPASYLTRSQFEEMFP